jgi:uncharacterized membrane protein YesL
VLSLRIAGRGLRDTIEHILDFVAATIAFWIGLASIVFAPAALLTLFYVADPRHGGETEQPSAAAALRFLKERWPRSWGLGLVTIPVVALLFLNMVFYGGHAGTLGALAPLWLVLFLIGLMIALTSFSVCALLDKPVKASLRLGFLITGKALPRCALVLLLIAILTVIGTFLILPLILFLPATIAAIINRLVLSVLNIAVADPNAPTPELLEEQAITGKTARFGGLFRR